MTMTPVFVGMSADGKPMHELRHPFDVFGRNNKPDFFATTYEKVETNKQTRMRHVLRRPATKQVIAMHKKGGPRAETFPATFRFDPTVSRQVRRQMERMPRIVEQNHA